MPKDLEIIELFFQRSEDALTEMQKKYGRLCRKIAYGILKSSEDAEECLNTSYLSIWNAIPPTRPDSLCAYLCAVVRNAAFETYRKNRYRSCEESFEELEDIIEDEMTVERLSDGKLLSELVSEYLSKAKPLNRKLFMARYYFNMSIQEMSERFGVSEAAVKTRLSRIRESLRSYLSERGVAVYE